MGLRVAGDPRWFYDLDRTSQRDVAAVLLPALRGRRRPTGPGGARLHPQVADGAELGWLFEGE